MVVSNADIRKVVIETPEGHQHLRTAMFLQDGTEIVLQEATIANIVRAYITVKTHPVIKGVVLQNRHLLDRKNGFAEWQLLEEQER